VFGYCGKRFVDKGEVTEDNGLIGYYKDILKRSC